MLKRVQRLAEAKRKAAAQKPLPKAPRMSDLSLRESPLTRALCFQVGRGQAATTMQAVARAAVSEAGAGNVSKSSCAAYHSLLLNPPVHPCFSDQPEMILSYLRHGLGVLDGEPWDVDVTHRGHAPQGCFSQFWGCASTLKLAFSYSLSLRRFVIAVTTTFLHQAFT